MANASISPVKDPSALRIIAHMNADHQDSLVRLLEAHHDLSSFSSRNAHLLDITFSSLIISVNPSKKPSKGTTHPNINTTYIIPLDPPMKDWKEARQRMVDLDSAAVKQLGRENITLKHYIPPTGFHLVVTTLSLLTFITFHNRRNLSPATAPSILQPLLARFPSAAGFLYNVQPKVLWPMVVLHLSEAVYMHFSRLRPLSVPTGSGLWVKWVVSTFVGGFGNFQAVDQYVQSERERKAKAKH